MAHDGRDLVAGLRAQLLANHDARRWDDHVLSDAEVAAARACGSGCAWGNRLT